MIKKYKIFYSWQSNLNKNTNKDAIRNELRKVKAEIKKKLNVEIIIDEATRNKSGSPNIPLTIFQKIDYCDIFICDLSTINTNDGDQKFQNPNVLIELGYAIATIGWERIILLFNKCYGNFPEDLPFDIDRHRCMVFEIKNKEDSSGKTSLYSDLLTAIKQIIKENPVKHYELRNISEKERRYRDIKNIKDIFNIINIDKFELFIDLFPRKIIKDIIPCFDGFFEIVNRCGFYIYDKALSKNIEIFKDYLEKSLSFYDQYEDKDNSKYYFFPMVCDIIKDKQAQKDFDNLQKLKRPLYKSFKDLVEYIRSNYIEIGLK